MAAKDFELLREEKIMEINSNVRLFRHVKTGAQVLSVENEDENKVFGASFRTPPPDDTGVPHILEHSVLSGSRKYPVKELFAEMVKGSMATFINAMTMPEQTVYPVASQNEQDFYNLVDVYMDVVFFPRLEPETLMQEGWHHELDGLEEEMIYRGVVFNEMKGNYAVPEMILYLERLRKLYPDTPYANNEAGDPAAIPDLTYEQWKGFHEDYYHPSNALLFFYGDDTPEKRLEKAAEYLNEFEHREIDSTVPVPSVFKAPQVTEIPYPVQADDDTDKIYVDISWGLPQADDVEQTYGLMVLGEVLMGTQAAPLRKALTESGLGENVMGGDVDTGRRRMVYTVGMKGVARDQVSEVEALVQTTLENLVETGIDLLTIQAALNTVEFRFRERNTGNFPRGLMAMFFALSTWAHDGDPFSPLAFEGPMNALKARVAEGGYFEGLIREHLLDNPHRSTILLVPDKALVAREREAEKQRIDGERMTMDEHQIREVLKQTEDLRERQSTPNSAEALATLPMLKVSDLDAEIKPIPQDIIDVNDVPIYYHDLATNGVFYVDLGFDLAALPQELVPYVPLFSSALTQMGTTKESFVQLQQRIGSKTGGVTAETMAESHWPDDGSSFVLWLRGKSTMDNVDGLIAIFNDLLTSTDFDDKDRFKQIVTQAAAQRGSMVIPAGHIVTLRRLAGSYHLPGWFEEQTNGLGQLFFLRDLLARIDSDWDDIRATLERMRELLFFRSNTIINVTAEAAHWAQAQGQVTAFINDMRQAEVNEHVWTPTLSPVAEGLTIPGQMNYVGKAANIYKLGYELHGSINVINRFLSIGYLYNNIRQKGGAYGMVSQFDMRTGVLRTTSYRDPNLVKTLAVYDGIADHLRNINLSDTELTQAIVGGIGQADNHMLPDAKGVAATRNTLTGYTDEARQRIRTEMLETTTAHFRALGEAIAEFKSAGVPVILGPSENIDEAVAELGLKLQIHKVL